jgi:hypothetical protein
MRVPMIKYKQTFSNLLKQDLLHNAQA